MANSNKYDVRTEGFYRDVTPRQLATMTQEDAEGLIVAECMEAGIKFRSITTPTHPGQAPAFEEVTVYEVIFGSRYDSSRLCFRTMEEAEHASSLQPILIESTYRGGQTVECEKEKSATEPQRTITSKKIVKREYVAALSTYKARCDEYEKAEKERTKELEGRQQITDDVWTAIRSAQAQQRQCERTKEVLAEYVKHANGDEAMARTFFVKAYSQSALDDMDAWFNPTADANELCEGRR